MRKLHAAFIIGNEHALAQQKDLFFRKIQEEHYVAVVPAESPLAGRESLSVQELRDVPLIPAGQEIRSVPASAAIFRPILYQTQLHLPIPAGRMWSSAWYLHGFGVGLFFLLHRPEILLGELQDPSLWRRGSSRTIRSMPPLRTAD